MSRKYVIWCPRKQGKTTRANMAPAYVDVCLPVTDITLLTLLALDVCFRHRLDRLLRSNRRKWYCSIVFFGEIGAISALPRRLPMSFASFFVCASLLCGQVPNSSQPDGHEFETSYPPIHMVAKIRCRDRTRTQCTKASKRCRWKVGSGCIGK